MRKLSRGTVRYITKSNGLSTYVATPGQYCQVSTWMGEHLGVGKLFRYVSTTHLGQINLPSISLA